MKKLLTVCLLAFAAAGATGCRSAAEGVKPKLMWLDCSANWVRFSYPDSIRYYVNKCREAGMTALVYQALLLSHGVFLSLILV